MMNEKERAALLKRALAESEEHYKELAKELDAELGIVLEGDDITELIEWLRKKGEI